MSGAAAAASSVRGEPVEGRKGGRCTGELLCALIHDFPFGIFSCIKYGDRDLHIHENIMSETRLLSLLYILIRFL